MTHYSPSPGPDRKFYFKFAAGVIGVPLVLVVVALWFRPTAEDRFTDCMALAESAGLLDTRSDAAALICLRSATERGGSDDTGPDIGVGPTGAVTLTP